MNSSFKTTSVENSVFGVIRAQDKNLYPDKRIAVPSIKTFKYLASGSVWVRWFVGWFFVCLIVFSLEKKIIHLSNQQSYDCARNLLT